MFGGFKKQSLLYPLIMLNLAITPGMAEVANFNPINIGDDITQDQASGKAGGNYSFLSLSNSDRDGNDCLGFGSSNPDHLLNINSAIETLDLLVETRGELYAIVVKTPSNEFICASGEDLTIQAPTTGEYQVWVGADGVGQMFNYRLIAETN